MAKKKINYKKKRLCFFISYAIIDSKLFRVQELAQYLKTLSKVHEIYYCEKTEESDFIAYMDKYLQLSDVMILLCSSNSNASEFVRLEYRSAIAMKKPIIPIFLDSTDIPTLCKSSVGFCWDPTNFAKNLKSLEDIIQTRAFDIDLVEPPQTSNENPKIIDSPIKRKSNDLSNSNQKRLDSSEFLIQPIGMVTCGDCQICENFNTEVTYLDGVWLCNECLEKKTK